MTLRLRLFFFAVLSFILSTALFAGPSSTSTTKPRTAGHVTERARAQKRLARMRHHRARRHTAARSAAAKSASAKTVSARTTSAKAVSAGATTSTTVATRRRVRRHRYVERFTATSRSDEHTSEL